MNPDHELTNTKQGSMVRNKFFILETVKKKKKKKRERKREENTYHCNGRIGSRRLAAKRKGPAQDKGRRARVINAILEKERRGEKSRAVKLKTRILSADAWEVMAKAWIIALEELPWGSHGIPQNSLG